MTRKLHRIALAAAAVAALGASTITAAASADSAPAKHSKTMTVCVKSAYIDAPAPGKIFVGTIFKGEHFHVDRTVRVTKGSAKGVWHHGKRIATNSKNGKTLRRHRLGPGFGLLRLARSTARRRNERRAPLGSPSHILVSRCSARRRRAASAPRPATAAS